MKGKRTSPEVRQRILDMAAAGKRYKEIIAKTGASAQTVDRIARGVPRQAESKKSSIPEELWREWDEVTKRLRGGRKRTERVSR